MSAGELEMPAVGALLLVPVSRAADVPKAIGWLGPVNHGLSGEDVSAVLRSWEERFGAVLVSIGFATLVVQVARRPESEKQLSSLVGEHHAFCPDNIDQGMAPETYFDGIAEWTPWSFWWD
jgi:hypothetical protein